MKVKYRDDGLIEIEQGEFFSVEDWREYQRIMLEILDAAEGRTYILTDFSKTQSFDPKIAGEFGGAKHLTHPRLGMLVLLGGNTLMNFALKVTEGRAQREGRNKRLRLHKDRERAENALLHQKKIEAIADADPDWNPEE